MRLATRLTLVLLVAVAVVLTGFGYIRVQQERRRLVADLREDVWVQAHIIKLAVEQALLNQGPEARQELLAQVEKEVDDGRVLLFDLRLEQIGGTISAPAAGATVPREALEQVVKTGQPVLRYLRAPPHPAMVAILPLRDRRNAIVGVLEVLHSAARVQREIGQAVWEQVIRLGLLSLTVAVAIFLAVQVSIRRPIGQLVTTALALGRGNLSVRGTLRRRDEIGQLASAFDQMAESLQAAQARLIEEGRVRLKLERELQQAQKLATVGRLASEVAHEISTPLNIISGRAEVIQKEVPPDHPLARHATVLLRQVERIGGIIRQLLDYTKPRHPAFGSVDAASVLNRTVELLEPLAGLHQVRLQAQAAADLPLILADPDQLQQVLLNLVVNSLDATPPGGEIRVAGSLAEPETPDARPHVSRGRPEGPFVFLTVSDTGSGMSRAQLDQIFEPFFSTKDRKGGTGLGIPIVEDIVRSHRGAIEVRSAEGCGTTIVLRWPIAGREAEEEPAGGGDRSQGTAPNRTVPAGTAEGQQ